MNWRQFLQCQFGRRDAMSDRVREAKPCPTERSDKKSRSLMGRTTQNPIRPRSVLSWCGIDSTAIDQTTVRPAAEPNMCPGNEDGFTPGC